METRKFVSWRRVSTKVQGRSGLGLEAQASIIDYFVKQEGGTLIADYSDVHTGKDLTGCKGLQMALGTARKEGATLIIAKTDRFRNDEEAISIYNRMRGNIFFCDLPNSDEFTIKLYFLMAARERLLIGLRTKQALAEKKKQGIKLGAPKGTDHWGKDGREKALRKRREDTLSNSNNKKALAFAKALREGGNTYKSIAETLNASSFKTAKGGSWRGNQVKRLLEAESKISL